MTARLATLLYPTVLGGATALVIVLLQNGVSSPIALGLTLGAVIVTLLVLESVLVFRASWRMTRAELRIDLCHTVVNLLVPPGWAALLQVLTVVIAARAPSHAGGWPASWPFAFQLLLAVAIAELGVYAMHRWIHATPMLWRLHRVHHGPSGLYWLNANRFHPLDLLLLHAASVSPLVLLGAGPELLAVSAIVAQTGSFLQHCNVEMRGGWLRWIFNVPEHHRWHHSDDSVESNHNFGGTFVLWDLVFGTLLMRDRATPASLGAGVEAPGRYLDQLLSPFRKELSR